MTAGEAKDRLEWLYEEGRTLSAETKKALEMAIGALDFVREQGTCEYCHEDSGGYVLLIEKNCHALVDGNKLFLWARGWNGEYKINYCPMCGRKLRIKHEQ